MTLRFRNRFTAKPSEVGSCKGCGLHITHTTADGRETFIHELPWCGAFRAFVEKAQPEPGTQLHMALGNVTDRETLVIADGDTIADVDVRP